MKKKTLFLIAALGFVLGLSACRNPYHIITYEHTDSYNEVFRGKYVPQDVR